MNDINLLRNESLSENYVFRTNTFKKTIIPQIAKAALKELVVSMLFTTLACCFVATPIGMGTLCLGALGTVTINVLLRVATANLAYQFLKFENEGRSNAQKACLVLMYTIKYAIPLVFAHFDSITRDVVVHEFGHAIAARSVYLLTKAPIIKVFPFAGGVTSISIRGFTAFGSAIGRQNCRRLWAAGGAIASIFVATIYLKIAECVKKSSPKIQLYLNAIAIVSIVNHVLYAAAALISTDLKPSHDFYQLHQEGIHPVVSIISILAIPLILSAWHYRKSIHQPPSIEDIIPELASLDERNESLFEFEDEYLLV